MSRLPTAERFELVRDRARLREVGPAWTRLWQRAGASVFQSHAWIEAWWDTRPSRPRVALRIGLLWRGEELVAILPVARRRHRGLRVLEWAAKDHSDYCDALALPHERGALERLWREMKRAGGFDLAYLSHLPEGARVHGLGLAPGERREVNLRVRGPWSSGAAWFDALAKKPRQNVRRGWSALNTEAGAARARLVGDEESLGPILSRLVALKQQWLRRTGQTSTLLADERPLMGFAEALRAQGLLRLFVIERAGEILAGSVNFVEDGRMAAFFAAYDSAEEKASLGMLLMTEYIRWAFDHGLREVDFLGGPEEYKLRYADTRLDLTSRVAAGTLLGRLALALDRRLTLRRETTAAKTAPKRRPKPEACPPKGSAPAAVG